MENLKKCLLILAGILISSMISLNAFSEPGYLGVNFEEITEEYAKANDLPVTYGVHIVSVVSGFGAEKAGIKTGDIILQIDGKKIDKSGLFSPIIAEKGAGEKIMLKVLRDGKEFDIEAVLVEKPEKSVYTIKTIPEGDFNIKIAAPGKLHMENKASVTLGGMYLSEMNPDLAEYFDTKSGYLVISVKKDSAADNAGFKAGDVILSVDDNSLTSEKDLEILYKKASKGEELNFKGIRKGKELSLKMKLKSDEIGTIDWFVNPYVYRIIARDSAREKTRELMEKYEAQERKLREETERIREEARHLTSEEAKKIREEKLKELEKNRKEIEIKIKERMKDIKEKEIQSIGVGVETEQLMKKMEQKMKEMELRMKELEKKLKEAESKNK